MKWFMLFIVNPIAFPHDPHFHEDMVWERVESFIFFFQIFLCVLCAFAVNRYGKFLAAIIAPLFSSLPAFRCPQSTGLNFLRILYMKSSFQPTSSGRPAGLYNQTHLLCIPL